MKHIAKRNGAVTIPVLIGICVAVAMAGAGYGLFMLAELTGELSAMSAKLDRLDVLTEEIKSLNGQLGLFAETNKRLKEMEGYMRYLPALTEVGKAGLQESINTGRKLDITNARLEGTNSFLQDTTRKLQTTNSALTGMRSDIGAMGDSIGKMAEQLPALEEMKNLLAGTNSDRARPWQVSGKSPAEWRG